MSDRLRSLIILVLAALASLAGAFPAAAQVRYTATGTATINNTAASCTAPLVRNFTVAAATVYDVDIGVLAAHSRRSDLRMTLQSPSGTRVTFVNGIGGSATNFNVLLSDQNATAISSHTSNDTATASTVVPPYQRNLVYAPQSPLSVFNGQAAAGTWRLEICDTTSGSSGTFYQSDLYITTSGADLSLAVSASSPSPLPGVGVTYTLTVANASSSNATATGITVQGTLPGSFTYRSQSGTGSFDSATGIWTVGSLAPGASASIQISGANNSTSGTVVSYAAQITASSVIDPDSTPNNGATGEDDYASASFTTAALPAAGTLPAYSCPVTTNTFDWDALSWTNGALSGNFTVNSIPISLALTGATGRFIADPATGSSTPARNTSTTGGAAGQNALMLAIDMATSSESVTATWTFAGGVGGLRFTMADIDLFFGQFVDRVAVTGSYNGTAVTPTLTNGQVNAVSGNTAVATAVADNATAAGNVTVTFNQPVDTVTIVYGPDAATSPASPGIQAISLMDMSFCSRATDLSLAKTVSNATPNGGDAISFTLSVANTTTRAMSTTGVTVSDVLPAGFTFTSASGTGTYNSTSGLWTIGNLAAGATASLTINGTVSAAAGATVTNTAQITASGLPDPDSTVNNGVTTEDDYAAVAFTVSSIINCPTGSTATGSGFASSGTGANLNRVFWLDWSCGSTSVFGAGTTVNKTWTAGDGLVITGRVTGITGAIRPYVTGTWGGDLLDNLYAGVNPIGLRNNVDGQDLQFSVTLSATLNGVTVPLRYVLADAEDSGGALTDESIQATTTGSAWSSLETSGSITVGLSGASATIHDQANGGGGTALLETQGSSVTMGLNNFTVGGTAPAFGFYTPFDWSDALTAMGTANHRIIPGFGLGAARTAEAAAYNSADASADSGDDGVTLPQLARGVAATIPVAISGPGFLSAWIDFNDDGDFADAGEQIAASAVDGGAGDSDGAVNGIIALAVSVPAGAATTPTIARFRYSSSSGSSISGLFGFGEVEDHGLTIVTPGMSVTKVSTIVSDPVNGSGANRKAIPGAVIEYCVFVTNSGTATATAVVANDTLPTETAYLSGTLATGATCATAATVEDDDPAGPDESDPMGAAYASGTITAQAASLAGGSTYAVKYRVMVN